MNELYSKDQVAARELILKVIIKKRKTKEKRRTRMATRRVYGWKKTLAYLPVTLSVLVFAIVDVTVWEFGTALSVTLVGFWMGVSNVRLRRQCSRERKVREERKMCKWLFFLLTSKKGEEKEEREARHHVAVNGMRATNTLCKQL